LKNVKDILETERLLAGIDVLEWSRAQIVVMTLDRYNNNALPDVGI
jgi:hypothetical protein